MLARHGYGVLLFDRRGEGRSEGEPELAGAGAATKDIKAGVAYLQHRPDVDPDRIGGIGLSVGGEMMLEAAAEHRRARGGRVRGRRRAVDHARTMDMPGVPDVDTASALPACAVKTAAVAVFANQRRPPT